MGASKSKNKCKCKCKYSINHHIIYILEYYPQYQKEFNDICNGFGGYSDKFYDPIYLENFNSYNDPNFMNYLSSQGIDFPTLCQIIASTKPSHSKSK